MRVSLWLKIFLVTAGIVLLTTLTTLFFVQRETEKSIYSWENKHAQNLINTVLLNVDNEYSSLLFHKESILTRRKSELKNIINIVFSNIDKYYQQYRAGSLTESQAKRLAIEEVKQLWYDDGVGYIWINNIDQPVPKMIMHPLSPELDGRILDDPKYNCVMDTGENLFTASVNICMENGDGYVKYLWPKPSQNGITPDQQKLSYVRLFPAWDWIVGTGVYIDDIEKEIKRRQDAILVELKETFSRVKVGESGYMFLFSGDMRMLVHPTLPKGFDTNKLINPATGKPLMENFIKTAQTPGKSFEYLWNKPGNEDNFIFWKRAYVRYFEPLDWYVASTVYNDESNIMINDLRKKIASLSILFVAVAFFLSSFLSHSLSKPLQKLTAAAVDIDRNGVSTANIPISGTIETRELGLVLTNLFHSIDQSENALRESEERLRTVIQSSIDAMIAVDSNGLIILFNPAAEKMFGYSEKDMVDQPLDMLIPDHFRAHHRNHLVDLFDGRMSYSVIGKTLERSARKNDGTEFTIELSLSEVRQGDEHLVFAIIRDITERKHLENQLSQAQKMESVGRLAGGIAHDFNNLLTVILGNAEMALEEIDPDNPLYDDILGIQKTGSRAANLTRQLLAFTRQQVVKPRTVNINAVIQDMEKMLRRLVSENIEFVTEYDPNLWETKIDPGQLSQVLTNLVVNAWDAMPDGGKLSLATQNIIPGNSFFQQHTKMSNTGYVMISVSDTGTGIDEEIQSKIFEPYFTTKDKGKGTGLGLAICYGIIKQNDGHVSIHSKSGQGTTMKIYLPKVSGDSPTDSQSPKHMDIPDGTETVLVVEDDNDVRTLVSSWLKKKGYTIIEASNGKEALEKTASFTPGDIDLILCDIVMPFIGGKELYDRFIDINPDTKVLFMSGHTEDFNALHGIENKELLMKPFSHSELIHSIQKVLQG